MSSVECSEPLLPSTLKDAKKLLKGAGFEQGSLPGQRYKAGTQPWCNRYARAQIELPRAGGNFRLDENTAALVIKTIDRAALA